MKDILDVLGGGFGDGKAYYKEQAYELIRAANNKWTPRKIDNKVKKYLEYGLLTRVADMQFRGYFRYKITSKGERALDHYRNAAGHKDLSSGVLF